MRVSAEQWLALYREVSRDCEAVEAGAWTQPLTRRLEMMREDAQAAFAANDEVAIEKAARALVGLGGEVRLLIAEEMPGRSPLQMGEDGLLMGGDA